VTDSPTEDSAVTVLPLNAGELLSLEVDFCNFK